MPRSLKRFFTSQFLDDGLRQVSLSLEETNHLSRVLRLKVNDECILFDSKGREWRVRISEFGKDNLAQVDLLECLKSFQKKQSALIVAQAVPQRAKMDTIVEKAAELGVDRLIPMVTERTVVRIKSEDEDKVLRRWSKIVQEARKQSGSETPTEIERPIDFKKLVLSLGEKNIYLFDPRAEELFPDVLSHLKEGLVRQDIVAMIGPEGGFTQSECDLALSKGARLVKLGNTILKTDTAFVAVASAIQIFRS